MDVGLVAEEESPYILLLHVHCHWSHFLLGIEKFNCIIELSLVVCQIHVYTYLQ